MNALEHLNQSLFLYINAAPDAAHAIIVMAKILTNGLLPAAALLVFLLLWFRHPTKAVEIMLQFVMVAVIGGGINLILGWLWQHPRPFMMGLGTNFLYHKAEDSFPSDHGTMAFALAVTFLFRRKYVIGVILSLVALTIAWSRIYLGIHFPLDFVGSLASATLSYFVMIYLIWPYIQPMMMRLTSVFIKH